VTPAEFYFSAREENKIKKVLYSNTHEMKPEINVQFSIS
jgi:hypothetical protein